MAPSVSWAAVGDCVASATSHANTDSLKSFKINAANWAEMNGLSKERIIGAIVAAAATWNEQANAGYFQYTGETTDDEVDCSNAWSLVYISNADDGDPTKIAFASAQGRCPSGGGNAKFRIIVYPYSDSSATPKVSIPWGDSATTSDRYDLQGAVTHEFGHTLDLGHPESIADNADVQATMRQGIAHTRRRQLYQWDMKCSRDLSGVRAVKPHRVAVLSDGTLGSPTQIGTFDVAKARGGVEINGGTGTRMATYHRGNDQSHDHGADGSYTNFSGASDYDGMGFVPTTWRENDSIDLIVKSDYEDFLVPYTVATSQHRARVGWSSNNFTSRTWDILYHCNSYTGFMTCSSFSTVFTTEPMAFGWIGGSISRTVAAWVHHKRNDENDPITGVALADTSDVSEIRIAVGNVAQNKLAYAHQTTLRSKVGPGLACYDDFSGGYDCLLAYVPMDDAANRIAFKRFTVTQVGSGYLIGFDGSTYGLADGMKTVNAIALVYHNGVDKFYVAFRQAAANQKLAIWSSTSGVSWSLVNNALDDTITGVSAGSPWRGSNNWFFYSK